MLQIMASSSQNYKGHNQAGGSGKVKVTILASEWGSIKGELSTINRKLAVELAKFSKVEITFLVPQCSEGDKKEALSHNINIVEAKKFFGFEGVELLCFPPDDLQIEFVIGHGAKLGHQAQVIRDLHKCKWVQVVHTDPEELRMFKSYPDPISKGEEKHNIEVKLCEEADFVVTIGPKLAESFHRYLQSCKNHETIFDFTPGIFEEFLNVDQGRGERKGCTVLVFGRGDAEDFQLKGYDIVGKAVASLANTQLIFVGAPDGKYQEIKQSLLDCGLPATCLKVRGYVTCRESLRKLFCAVDLVVMPSRTDGFGLTGLEALSAGLPVLVSKNSGFGESLSKLPFGSSFVIDSEKPEVWAAAIKNISDKERQTRLEEVQFLRSSYKGKYSWTKQSEALLVKIIKPVRGLKAIDVRQRSKLPLPVVTKKKELGKDEKVSGTSREKTSLPEYGDSLIELLIRTSDLTKEQEEKVCNLLVPLVQTFVKSHDYSSNKKEGVAALTDFINKAYEVSLVAVNVGSLKIIVECPTLRSLENLWNDYLSGHLNKVAERYLVTAEMKKKVGLETINLTTTIDEENYMACRKFLTKMPGGANSALLSCQQRLLDQGSSISEMTKSADYTAVKEQDTSCAMRMEKAKVSRSALHRASINGQYEEVNWHLKNGANVNERDQFLLTPLHLACWYGYESVVKLLLDHNADVNAVDKFQFTPLQKAERYNHQSIIQLLLDHDAKPSFKQPLSLRTFAKRAFLCMDSHSGFNLLQAAVLQGDYDSVSKASTFLENFVEEMKCQTISSNASIFRRNSAVDILLSKNWEQSGHADIGKLYQRVVEIDETLNELYLCAKSSDAEKVIELVLNDGMDVNVTAKSNITPLLFVSPMSSGVLVKTLIDLGADVNAQTVPGKRTPLLFAASSSNYMVATLLLEHGADANIDDQWGKTPLHKAVTRKDVPLVKLLLENKANANIQDQSGNTPLHLCAIYGLSDISQLLIESGCNINLRNNKGKTPRDIETSERCMVEQTPIS